MPLFHIQDNDRPASVSAKLYHPVLGRVLWEEIGGLGSGFVLCFADGPEKGEPLWDDEWERAEC